MLGLGIGAAQRRRWPSGARRSAPPASPAVSMPTTWSGPPPTRKARWKPRASRPVAWQKAAMALPTPRRLAKSMNRSAAHVSTCVVILGGDHLAVAALVDLAHPHPPVRGPILAEPGRVPPNPARRPGAGLSSAHDRPACRSADRRHPRLRAAAAPGVAPSPRASAARHSAAGRVTGRGARGDPRRRRRAAIAAIRRPRPGG